MRSKDTEEKILYVITYDITSTRRLKKVANFAMGFGRRVQKSVFEARLGNKEHEKMLRGLKRLVTEQDRLVVMPVTAEGERKILRLGMAARAEPPGDEVIFL